MWAIVLLIAFFANRGEDVGMLGKLFGNLGGGAFAGAGIVDSIAGAVTAFAILIAWFGLGSLIARFVPVSKSENHSHVLELAMRIAVGAAGWSFIWFFLGVAGLYSTAAVLAVQVAGVALAVFGFNRVREAKDESRVPETAAGFDKLLLLLIAVPVVLSFIASMAPPTSKDTLLYHFALPKAFIAQGGNDFVTGNIASYLSLGTEMHTVWAMLLGGLFSERAGEAAAGATVWLFFPLLLAAVFGFAREIGITRRWSLVAVLMAATVPTAYHVASSAYIDVALAFFVLLAVYGLSRWWQSLETGWLVFVAVFLGAALSAKLTTVFVIAAFALVIMMRARSAQSAGENAGRIVGLGIGALLLAGFIASPWYLRTWAETGSPVFPFYMSIWPAEAPGWDLERSNLFQAMNSQYGGDPKAVVDYIAAPWNLSVAAQPELPAYFDGVLGVAFLIGLPFLIWGLWKLELPAAVKIGSAVASVMFLFWLSSSQQLRYLLPIMPLLAIGIAAAFEKIGESENGLRSIGQIALVAAGIAGILTGGAWFLKKAPLRVVLGGETRDEYLTRNIDYYPYYKWLNTESAADAKVWLINMRRDTYHLDRPYFSDYLFEDVTLRHMLNDSRNAPELKAKAAAMGIKYILVRHDFLFNYDVSPLVDDAKPRAENEAKLKMAKELLLDPARTVKADNRFGLVKLY
ncbi:MAG: glycosyltransferase family 39 protein [Pyrinomonadaceae bacterium]|nr:glycosyltransferase family 39 protein [Pyrinomonadaceae bacterium]